MLHIHTSMFLLLCKFYNFIVVHGADPACAVDY